jgi:ABC-2 type transport system permease protein
MSRALAIAWKDLRHTFRNPVAMTMMLLAPLVLAALLGAAFGGGGGFSISATKTGILNQDAGFQDFNAGNVLASALGSADLKDLITLEPQPSEAVAKNRVETGKDSVAVLIPADFSAAMQGATGAKKSTVTLYRNPTLVIGPGIVAGVVGSVVDALNGSLAAAAGTVGLLMGSGVSDQATLQQAGGAAVTAFAQQAQSNPGVAIETRGPRVDASNQTHKAGVAGQVLAGMMIFFMFIAASNAARSIMDEDRQGTLPRLFTTPTTRATVLGGKYVSVFATVLTQAIILLAAGRLIFGTYWGQAVAVVVLTLAMVGVATGLGILVVSFMKTPAQAGALGSGVYLILALAGGNFVGTTDPGGAFGTIRKFTPNGWLLTGWDTTMRGGTLRDILVPVLVCLAWAAATFTVGALMMRRRYR